MKSSKNWKISRDFYSEPQDEKWDHSPNILDNEVFSSYFTRAAKMNIAEPLSILRILENEQITSNRFDIDRHIKIATIKKIAQYLNQEEELLKSICLIPKKINSKNKFTLNGSRYCPFCLEEDKDQPYFRFHWRLNFIAICKRHKCFLEEKCPKCGSLVQYWKTKFNQSIIKCYRCGENLINAKYKVEKVRNDDRKELLFNSFQDTLVNIYKCKEWRGNPIEAEKFFRKLWRLAWAFKVNALIYYNRRYEESWQNYMKKSITSSKETFNAIFSAFKVIQSDPERIDSPLICPIDGKRYVNLSFFLRHLHTHKGLNCPLEKCESKNTVKYKDHYRCRKCGTEFSQNGEIKKRGKVTICPFNKCGSTSISLRKDDLQCRICGTIFLRDQTIIKIGKKLNCPLKFCNSTNTRIYFENKYKCFTCSTIFTPDGKIIQEGKRLKCPLKRCQSEEIRVRKNGFKCENCGSLPDIKGKLVEEGIINNPRCPFYKCRSKSVRPYKNRFLCYHCGTEFNKDGKILIKGKRPVCPLKECGSSRTWIKFYPNIPKFFICRKCGTEFTDKGVIKKGRSVICPECRSRKTRADKENYHCERCGAKFILDGEIIESGTVVKCPLEICGSKMIYRRMRKSSNICKLCGTEFLVDGTIVRERKRMICPLCESRNTRFKIQKNNEDEFYCYKCGTEFTYNSRIIKKGNIKQCPTCNSKRTQVRLTKDGFKCRTCGKEFV